MCYDQIKYLVGHVELLHVLRQIQGNLLRLRSLEQLRLQLTKLVEKHLGQSQCYLDHEHKSVGKNDQTKIRLISLGSSRS